MLSGRGRRVSIRTVPRFTLSMRTPPVSRRAGGMMTRLPGDGGGLRVMPKVSRGGGDDGRGMGVAPGTTRPPSGLAGMLLRFVSRGNGVPFGVGGGYAGVAG